MHFLSIWASFTRFPWKFWIQYENGSKRFWDSQILDHFRTNFLFHDLGISRTFFKNIVPKKLFDYCSAKRKNKSFQIICHNWIHVRLPKKWRFVWFSFFLDAKKQTNKKQEKTYTNMCSDLFFIGLPNHWMSSRMY